MSNELLKPRYEVIADYPNSIWYVGDIIENIGTFAEKHIYDKYPHLFRRLEWWEKRDELPMYVKHKSLTTVFEKVVRWITDKPNKCPLAVVMEGYEYFAYELLPATEAEYNEFKK